MNGSAASLLGLIDVTIAHRQLGRWLYYQMLARRLPAICINQILAEALVLVLAICHNFEGFYEIQVCLIEVTVCIMWFCPAGLAQFKQRFAPGWMVPWWWWHWSGENPSFGWTWRRDRLLPLDPRPCAHLKGGRANGNCWKHFYNIYIFWNSVNPTFYHCKTFSCDL